MRMVVCEESLKWEECGFADRVERQTVPKVRKKMKEMDLK